MISPRAPGPTSRFTWPPERPDLRLCHLRLAELPLDTVELARFLIGAALVSESREGRSAARIVETEAYVPGDEACHAYRRETARNGTLFRRRGHAYVYFIYGTSFCINVSSESEGVGAGVLIRAAEPLRGIDLMRARRPLSTPRDLLRGPGRLATALAVTRAFDGLDLCRAGPLWLAAGEPATGAIGESRRIGLTKGVDRVLRFFERGSPYLSGPGALNR